MNILSTLGFMPRRFMALVFSVCAYSVAVNAANISTTNYDMYLGDLNGDGYSDYYFAAKPFLLLLHGDIITPIVIPFPGVTSFVIYRSGAGYADAQSFLLDTATLSQKLIQGTLRPALVNTDFYIWNNGITGQSSVLFRGADSASPSLLLNSFSAQALPLLVQTYSPNPTANLSNRSLPITISDANADGKSDILIGGYVYLADASGVPSLVAYQTSQTGPIVTTFSYDKLGRVEKVEATDGTLSNYRYDLQDNRTSTNNTKGVQ